MVDFEESVGCVDGAAAMHAIKDKERRISHRWKSDGRRWKRRGCELRIVSCEENARMLAFICVNLIFICGEFGLFMDFASVLVLGF